MHIRTYVVAKFACNDTFMLSIYYVYVYIKCEYRIEHLILMKYSLNMGNHDSLVPRFWWLAMYIIICLYTHIFIRTYVFTLL